MINFNMTQEILDKVTKDARKSRATELAKTDKIRKGKFAERNEDGKLQTKRYFEYCASRKNGLPLFAEGLGRRKPAHMNADFARCEALLDRLGKQLKSHKISIEQYERQGRAHIRQMTRLKDQMGGHYES